MPSCVICSAPNWRSDANIRKPCSQMRTALEINPKLHFARLQLGLLYLTMSQPNDSLAVWAPLEDLDESAALKAFKRGLEALIRDDFPPASASCSRASISTSTTPRSTTT